MTMLSPTHKGSREQHDGAVLALALFGVHTFILWVASFSSNTDTDQEKTIWKYASESLPRSI